MRECGVVALGHEGAGLLLGRVLRLRVMGWWSLLRGHPLRLSLVEAGGHALRQRRCLVVEPDFSHRDRLCKFHYCYEAKLRNNLCSRSLFSLISALSRNRKRINSYQAQQGSNGQTNVRTDSGHLVPGIRNYVRSTCEWEIETTDLQ